MVHALPRQWRAGGGGEQGNSRVQNWSQFGLDFQQPPPAKSLLGHFAHLSSHCGRVRAELALQRTMTWGGRVTSGVGRVLALGVCVLLGARVVAVTVKARGTGSRVVSGFLRRALGRPDATSSAWRGHDATTPIRSTTRACGEGGGPGQGGVGATSRSAQALDGRARGSFHKFWPCSARHHHPLPRLRRSPRSRWCRGRSCGQAIGSSLEHGSGLCGWRCVGQGMECARNLRNAVGGCR